jgi:hypothetical protein
LICSVPLAGCGGDDQSGEATQDDPEKLLIARGKTKRAVQLSTCPPLSATLIVISSGVATKRGDSNRMED